MDISKVIISWMHKTSTSTDTQVTVTLPIAFTKYVSVTHGYIRSSAGGNHYPVMKSCTVSNFKFVGDSETTNHFIAIGY